MHQHSRLYTQGFFSFMCITLYFPFSLVRLWIYKERGREEGAFFGIINSRIVTIGDPDTRTYSSLTKSTFYLFFCLCQLLFS